MLQHATLVEHFQTTSYFLGVLSAVECRNTKVTFSLRAKPATRRDHHVQLAQHSIEHLPARKSIRRFHPDVGRVYSAKSFQPSIEGCVAKKFCIPHVVLDQSAHLLATFW